MTRKHGLYFVALCSVIGLNLVACSDDTNSHKSCTVKEECAANQVCELGECVEDTCHNNFKDANESGVDCGGTSSCGKCELGKTCTEAKDCHSDYCDNTNKCAAKTCTPETACPGDGGSCDLGSGLCISCEDGMKNGDETDIDCGGSCKAKCGEGKTCALATDCESRSCNGTTCGPKPEGIGLDNLVINEVMAAPKSGKVFLYNDESAQCEFVEIVNKSNQAGSLDGIVLGMLKEGDAIDKATQVKLSGTIPAKGVHVVHNCSELPLPEDATYSNFLTKDGSKVNTSAITNGKGYQFSLVKVEDGGSFADGTVGSVFETTTSKDGISYTRNPDITGETIVLHNEIDTDAADASPGYCNNGGTFSEGCIAKQESCDPSDAAANCGGTCKSKCDTGKTCKVPSDCISGTCEGDKCVGGAPEKADLSKLLINEVMGAPKSGTNFAIQNTTAECEFVEIVNLDDKAVSVEGITLELLKDKGETVTKSYPLEGVIPANGVLVVSEKDIPMPADGINIKKLSNSITNGSEYYIRLSDGTTQASNVIRAVVASKDQGKSQNRSADKSPLSETLTLHDVVSTKGYANSPGYCANGGLFSKDCDPSSAVDIGGGGEVTGDDPCEGATAHAKLLITEVLLATSGTASFSIQHETTCKFVEFINTTSADVPLDGLSLVIKEVGGSNEVSVSLNGQIIKANNAFVVGECDPSDGITTPLPLPENVGYMKASFTNKVTNSKNYTVAFSDGTNTFGTVLSEGTSESNNPNSNALPTERTYACKLVSNKGKTYANTAGVCNNGALYADNCALKCSNNQKEFGETDVDCGGVCADNKCAIDKSCWHDTDCETNHCTAKDHSKPHTCQMP